MPPYTLEFVFRTPQKRPFGAEKRAYIEEDGVLVATTLKVKTLELATSVRLESATHEPHLRRMHLLFRLGRPEGSAWVGALANEGVVFNGRGYLQAGLHENDPTEERLLYTLAELFDWNGVVSVRQHYVPGTP